MENKKPEHDIKAGDVQATFWKNQSDKGEYLSIQLTRSYKDKQDQWQKQTINLRVNDLPKIAMICNKAYEWAKTNKEE